MTSELVLHLKKSTIIPLIIVIIIATCLTSLAVISGLVYQAAVIFPEEIGGAAFGLLNALFYLGFGIVGGVCILLIIKYGKMKLLRGIMFTCFLLITTMIIILYGSFLAIIFHLNSYEIPLFIISIVLGILTVYQIFSEKTTDTRKNLALLIIGGSLGSFLGVFLPSWTAFLMLTLFSIWDIYAVKKGPIKQIVELTSDYDSKITNTLSFSSEEWEIGLGDLVFYTMLSSHVLYVCNAQDTYFSNIMKYGPIVSVMPFFMTIIGILIGAKITFRLLLKSKMLPGLPISIGLGILCFLSTILFIVVFLKPIYLF